MPKIDVYDVGAAGVNVDDNPIQLKDGELTSAQNASQDPLGSGGGLRKRPGLAKFNSIAGSGSFLGGVGVPLPFPGGASTAVRSVYIGYASGASGGTSLGWLKFTGSPASGSVTVTGGTPAFPRADAKITYNFPVTDVQTPLGASGCGFDNRIYYAADGYVQYPTAGYESPPVRVWDGTVDKELCRVPYNPDAGATTKCLAVISMLAANNLIYVSTYDKGTDDTTFMGRVFSLDPNTGQLTQLGPTFPTGHLPVSMCWAFGRLWIGTYRNDPNNQGRIYFFRPGVDTTWTLDRTVAANYTSVASLCVYRGLLYASELGKQGTAGIITVRAAAGTWSTSDTGPSTDSFPSAGTNGFGAMIVFNDALYAAYNGGPFAGNYTRIRKYNGTSWSTVYTSSIPVYKIRLFRIFNNVLYATSGFNGADSGSGNDFMYSVAGTSWVNLTSSVGLSSVLEEITS